MSAAPWFSPADVRRQLEALGYTNVPEDVLADFVEGTCLLNSLAGALKLISLFLMDALLDSLRPAAPGRHGPRRLVGWVNPLGGISRILSSFGPGPGPVVVAQTSCFFYLYLFFFPLAGFQPQPTISAVPSARAELWSAFDADESELVVCELHGGRWL